MLSLRKSLALLIVGCGVLSAGCGGKIFKSFTDLNKLQSEISKQFAEKNVRVNLMNDTVLTVTFLNSSLNSKDPALRSEQAKRIAEFAGDHYPAIKSIKDLDKFCAPGDSSTNSDADAVSARDDTICSGVNQSSPNVMKRLHLIFGLVVVVVFLLTGQYMDRFLNHLDGMPDGPRMLYRTRHIFILLAGLLNLGIGTYYRTRKAGDRRILQALGSALIVTATILFIAGFFYEPGLTNLETPLSHWGMYAVAAGTFLHLLSGLGPRGIAATDEHG